MTRLELIKDTAQQIAEAITAALGFETEIIDDELTIVAGTGRYKKKIGLKEEGGDRDSGYIYGKLLKSGETFVIKEASPEPPYGGMEHEKAEVCCPIMLNNEVVGLIALVAFTDEQQRSLNNNSGEKLIFLERMAFLISSRISQIELESELNVILETIGEGIIAIDNKGVITSCNLAACRLMKTDRSFLIGSKLNDYWPQLELDRVMKTKKRIDNLEISCLDQDGIQRNFITAIDPVRVKKTTAKKSAKIYTGAVFAFSEFQNVRDMIYNLSERHQVVTFNDILGRSRSFHDVLERAKMIAQSSSTVLVTGESGTGKEMFARAIHFEGSRSSEPFVTVNCGAIPESLLESELFGYDEGAFTGAKSGGKVGKFELAHGGTIFLDEIGDLPLHLQGKLLHVLQRREIERVGSNRIIPVDVRVIAATNRDLGGMMHSGEFREDLYFRLCVIPLHIPPMRERKDDLELILRFFLLKFNKLLGKNIEDFSPEAMKILEGYDWPGNVREMENAMEYAVNFEEGPVIKRESIQPRIRNHKNNDLAGQSLQAATDHFQKKIITACLEETGFSLAGKKEAAARLNISESTLYRRIRELKIIAP